MAQKPKLYVFLVDTSYKMKNKVNQINKKINNKLSKIIKSSSGNKNDFFTIIRFNSTPKPDEIFKIVDYGAKLKKKDFYDDKKTDFPKAINFSNDKIQEWSEKYVVQTKPIIYTNLEGDKLIDRESITTYEILILKSNFIKQTLILFTLLFLLLLFLRYNEYNKIKNTMYRSFNTSEIKKFESKFKVKFNIDIQIPIITLNPTFEYSFQTVENNPFIINYYPDAGYNIYDKDAKIPFKLAEISKQSLSDFLNKAEYRNESIKLEITGVTDSTRVKNRHFYKGEMSSIKTCFIVNGEKRYYEINKGELIKHNELLACLRAYNIGFYLSDSDYFKKCLINNVIYFADTLENKELIGGKYRKTKIKVIVMKNNIYCWLYFFVLILIVLLVLFYLFVKNFRGKIVIFEKLISFD